MSEYRIKSTGEVKTRAQIISMHSNVSMPRIWNTKVHESLGIDPVSYSPKPDASGDYKIVVRNGVEQDGDGNWSHAWTEEDMFQEYTDGGGNVVTVQDQIDAKVSSENAELETLLRTERDSLLRETDHYGLSDMTMSSEMTTYRQTLRDIPQQEGFPTTVVWPENL